MEEDSVRRENNRALLCRMKTYCILNVVVVLRRPGCELEKLHGGFHDTFPRDLDVGGRVGG